MGTSSCWWWSTQGGFRHAWRKRLLGVRAQKASKVGAPKFGPVWEDSVGPQFSSLFHLIISQDHCCSSSETKTSSSEGASKQMGLVLREETEHACLVSPLQGSVLSVEPRTQRLLKQVREQPQEQTMLKSLRTKRWMPVHMCAQTYMDRKPTAASFIDNSVISSSQELFQLADLFNHHK